jgi:hypothetical protein
MTAQEIVARYYDAWQTKSGDLTDVPLADDFQFSAIRRRQHSLLDHRLGNGDPGGRPDDVRRAARGPAGTQEGTARVAAGRWSVAGRQRSV